MKKTILLGVVCLSTLTLSAQQIDTRRSVVRFSLSNLKWRTIEGTFTGIRGEIIFDEKDLESSSFRICFDASTIHTGKPKRDADLRSANYFETDTYPLICFDSEKIIRLEGAYRTTGKLTMHGITRDVEINFTLIDGLFRGRLTVMRYDYGIGLQTGTFTVGNQVNMDIRCVLEK
jgi:polyisoprenoid-binding protein YceI